MSARYRKGRMRVAAIVGALVISALGLTGCGNLTTADGDRSSLSEYRYVLKDGRTVVCMKGSSHLSCDWEHAK